MRAPMTSAPMLSRRLENALGLAGSLLLSVCLCLQLACSGGQGGSSAPITPVLPPSDLNYTHNPVTYTVNDGITPNPPSHKGGTPDHYSVNPALPVGLDLDTKTGVISGTPTTLTPLATYVVIASNTGGSTSADLTITVNPAAPSITTQPQSRAISLGLATTFHVVATGTGTLTYQWQKNGVDISSGGTSDSYTTPAATRTDDGASFRVIVKDGYGGQTASDVAILGVLPGSLAVVPDLSVGRHGHAAVELASHKILIVGGRSSAGPLNTAEIYDPVSQTFTTVAATLSQARVSPTATLLNDGTVLILGGWNTSGYVGTAEIFTPGTPDTFTPVASLAYPRALHTATLLNDGNVLIAGGTDGHPLAHAEIYNTTARAFAPTAGDLNTARVFHTASLLPDHTILIAGGFGAGSLASAEIYDPSTGHFTMLSSHLLHSRYLHTATVLMDGTVLFTGGIGATGTLATAERYTPGTGLFTAAGSMVGARQIHAATLLGDGKVLISGGWTGATVRASFERYDPGTGLFTGVSGPAAGYHSHIAVLLSDGTVLIVGGYNGAPLPGAALWQKD